MNIIKKIINILFLFLLLNCSIFALTQGQGKDEYINTNMGINTISPSEKLEIVDGNIKTNFGINAATATIGGVTFASVVASTGTLQSQIDAKVPLSIFDASGDTIYGSANDTVAKLSGNTTTTKKFISQTGNGSISATPAWDTIAQANVAGLTIADSPTFAGATSSGTFNSKGDLRFWALDGRGMNGTVYVQARDESVSLLNLNMRLRTMKDGAVVESFLLDNDGGASLPGNMSIGAGKKYKINNIDLAASDVNAIPVSYIDTDGTLTANSDVKVASQKATKTYADTKVSKVSSTNNAIVRFDSTLGAVQDSSATVDDNGRISDAKGFITPVGAIIMHSSSTVPVGWLICDGTALSRTAYSELFAVIGTTWGSGDGSTTFNIPDFRGMFLRGAGVHGTEAKALGGNYDGGNVGTFDRDSFQGHFHESGLLATNAGGFTNPLTGITPGVTTSTFYAQEAATGNNGVPRIDNETKPASYSIVFIIKF